MKYELFFHIDPGCVTLIMSPLFQLICTKSLEHKLLDQPHQASKRRCHREYGATISCVSTAYQHLHTQQLEEHTK
jgi:hypothetical protein